MNNRSLSAERRRKTVLSVVLGIICIIYVLPVLTVVINSFKLNTYVKTDTFALPNAESFAGWANFIKGLTFGNYPFLKSAGYSLFITIVSTALILLCTSMAAWYIARVDSKLCRAIYYLCVFSMVVPFQMVMFTLSKTADTVKLPYFNFASGGFRLVALNTPWTIPIIYLGFGAGLGIFMFVGFVKSIPLEIEEAAAIDGAGHIATLFKVFLPMNKIPIMTVGMFYAVARWNEFFRSSVYLTSNKNTVLQVFLRRFVVEGDSTVLASLGNIDLTGVNMSSLKAATIVVVILPILCMYPFILKHYTSGVMQGGVKE